MSDITAIYEKVLEDFKGKRSGRIKRQVKNVLNLINLASDEKIIEIGVATGKFTSIISRRNDVFALDFSFDNLQRTKKTVSELGDLGKLSCINADCSYIPFRDSSVDKVLAIDVAEHLRDTTFDLLCKEAYRIVKKNGSFYIYTPNLLHPYELARPFRPILRREHIGVRSRRVICKFLESANFKIIRSYFTNCYRRINIEAKKE